MFLSLNYRLIVNPESRRDRFDVVKTNICQRSEARFEGKYASFKNIKFLRGNYQADISETLYCLYCSPRFLPRATSKIILNYFQLFEMKAVKAKCNIKTKTDKTPLMLIFLQTRLCTEESGVLSGVDMLNTRSPGSKILAEKIVSRINIWLAIYAGIAACWRVFPRKLLLAGR